MGFLDTQSNANNVEALYTAYFGRAGDGPGYLYWNNQLATEVASGIPIASAVVDVSSAFAVQPEAKQTYSFLLSPPQTLSTTDPTQIAGVQAFISQIYQDLFNRAADTDGLNYWQKQILTGHVSVGSAVYAIGNGALGSDQGILTQKIAGASYFTSQTYAANLVSGSTFIAAAHAAVSPIVDATSEAASVTATNLFVSTAGAANTALTLTPGADTFSTSTAGAVFSAPLVSTSTQTGAGSFNIQTLSTGDKLTDSVLDGTLNASLVGVNAFNVTMAGIKTANLTSIGFVAPGGGVNPTIEGNIGGLATVNLTNSQSSYTLGAAGAGLLTPLVNYNVTGFFGGNGSQLANVAIAAAAGNASNTINVGLSGLLGGTGAGAADTLTFTTDGNVGTKASPALSYGTWAITANNNANLQLQEGGVGGATTLKLLGAGSDAIGQDAAGNWQNLTKIDASAATGNITITGAAAGVANNAAATAANPFGKFGSAFGLLNGNTALTSFSLSGGASTDVLDVSSFTTAAQLAALTTVAGTNTGTANEIIVSSANADATVATTWANIKGFQILGDVSVLGDTGIINLANLPTSINDVLYQTPAVGNVQIQNLPTAFTVDTEANGGGFNLTVGAVGPAAGTADSFTLIVGSTAVGGPGHVGNVTITGEEIVTLTAQGPTGGVDTVGFMALTPTTTGSEKVTIGGAYALAVGAPLALGGLGAIEDITPGSNPASLFANNLTIAITDTKAVTFNAGIAGLLSAPVLGDTGLSPINSTNALTIDAHTSGGLIMLGGDANFTSSITAAGSVGDTILGSTTAGNVLGGSIGNDTITGTSSTTAVDVIYTAGGADTITLASGHTAIDHIGLYATNGSGINAGDGSINAQFASIVDGADIPQLGWFGQATGQVGGAVQSVATNLGTAAGVAINTDLSTVANFVAGSAAIPQDVVDISTGAFGGPGILSLLHNDFGGFAALGTSTFSNPLAAGGTVTTVGANVLVLSGTYAGAAGVVNSLAGAGAIHFGGAALPANGLIGDHFIVAYQDSVSNSVHIADLDIHSFAAGGITTTAGGGGQTVALSDMVQLTGVAVTALHNGNIHFVA